MKEPGRASQSGAEKLPAALVPTPGPLTGGGLRGDAPGRPGARGEARGGFLSAVPTSPGLFLLTNEPG